MTVKVKFGSSVLSSLSVIRVISERENWLYLAGTGLGTNDR